MSCTCHTYQTKAPGTYAKGYDPTHTTALRNAFVRDMNRRFGDLRKVIRKAIIDEDCFGLQQQILPRTYAELAVPTRAQFAFPRSQDKVDGFMRWLKAEEQKGLLKTGTATQIGSGIESGWTNVYITDSYKRGVQRAAYELKKSGYKLPDIEARGGADFAVFGNPVHADRIGVLYSRVFEDLKGITSQMDTQISRVLGMGLADGDGPLELARKLNTVVSGMGETLAIRDSLGRYIPAQRRAQMLARTEVIRAHHQGLVQEYQNWGVTGVNVLAEWRTAGDGRVCPECAALQGRLFTLEEIRPMIPYHPNCRCMALPVKVDE